MRLSILASEIPTEKTHIRSGDHHQIWLGTPDITLMFESDSEMLAFVTDLYSKTVAAIPDEFFADLCTCGHSRQEHVCEPMVCLTCPVGSKCVGFKPE